METELSGWRLFFAILATVVIGLPLVAIVFIGMLSVIPIAVGGIARFCFQADFATWAGMALFLEVFLGAAHVMDKV